MGDRIAVKERVDARRERRGEAEALALAREARRILIARGKKLLDYDLRRDPPSDEELVKGMIGPSGNLRAPTLVVGKTVVVGFHPEAYEELFG